MKDWIEKVFDFLVDVIKFVSPVITFLLGIFYERMKLKREAKNLKQIILAELIHFLATFILYSLKCYMQELVRRINGILFTFILYRYSLKYYARELVREQLSNGSDIKTIEEAIKDDEEKLKESVGFILHDKKSKDETFGWIFILSKKYEESFPKEIVKEIKDLQESIEDFYDELEKFHKGLIDAEIIEHFWKKYESIKPEIEDIYFDMKLTTQSLTDIKDFDKELTKEVIEILNGITRLSNKKSNYVKPHSCTEFVEEVKPLIFKIDKLLEKERTNL
jgi:hypothetical protein